MQSRLIDDLLESSRIDRGKVHLTEEPLDLCAVARAACDDVQSMASAKSIDLSLTSAEATCTIDGDADRLRQVIWNLLVNAIKFTPAGGRVAVRVDHEGERARVIVTDTGVGICPAFLPYVFDRFRQQSPATGARGSLGLGLAIARQLVELHGGTIRGESEGENKGATFTVELPMKRAS
jgi:signal transduction histidine kinase